MTSKLGPPIVDGESLNRLIELVSEALDRLEQIGEWPEIEGHLDLALVMLKGEQARMRK